jgi:hypothetical protein
MRVSSSDFLFGLRINQQYFFKVLKKIGVHSRYFFDDNDLEIIVNKLPICTFKTALISECARDILSGTYEHRSR